MVGAMVRAFYEREREEEINLIVEKSLSPRHPQTDRRTSASSERRTASSPGSSVQSSSAGSDIFIAKHFKGEACETYKFVVADEDLDSTKLEDHESSEDLPCCLRLESCSVVLQRNELSVLVC